jgi:hypothetical protein
MQVLEKDPPAPRSLNAAIPLDLETIARNLPGKGPRTGDTARQASWPRT